MLLKITIFSKNLIYLILLKIIFIKTNKVVLLDFNSSFKTGLNTGFSFIDDLQERNLYSILNIGEPEHEIKTILSMKHSYFALIPNNNLDKNNNLYNDYDITKSNTFKNITCLNQHIFESQNDIIAEEKIKLKIFNYKNNIYNETFLNNINLIIGINDKYKENKYLLNIGLQIIVENKYREKQNYNFICQLKEKNIINNYYWSIFFDRGEVQNGAFLYNPNELFNAKGKLVIGDLPSNYNPNNFHKSQLLSTYSFGKDFISTWAIEFNSIFYYDKNNKQVKDTYSKVHININEYIVNAPNSYK